MEKWQLQAVEMSAFKLSALAGATCEAVEAIPAMLQVGYTTDSDVRAALVSWEDLLADLAKPLKVEVPEGTDRRERRRIQRLGRSALRYATDYMGWNPEREPVPEEMLAAYERGIARWETARQQPVPVAWPNGREYGKASDAHLILFPHEIRRDGDVVVNCFWMEVRDECPTKYQSNLALVPGQVIRPPWYASRVWIGYGDVSDGRTGGPRVELPLTGTSPGSWQFVCPDLQKVSEHVLQERPIEELLWQQIVGHGQ